jgi:hypothetical protein
MKKQPEHSLFAFSASPRWATCPGSMAYPENTAEDQDGGFYADEGTAAHTLAALLLKSKSGMKAEDWIGKVIRGGKREFEITEEFAGHVQTYVDDVQRRAIGGFLMVEQRVTLAGVEGFDESNYGTSDAIIGLETLAGASYGVVEDLKFGQGEKVYAWEPAREDSPFTMEMLSEDGDEPLVVVPNYQLMMYALACLADIQLLIDNPTYILIVINQPRIGHVSELRVRIEVLERFALFAAEALKKAEACLIVGVEQVEKTPALYNPGEKQCRWCKALARCPAAAKKAQEEVGADFNVIAADPPVPPIDPKRIARAMLAVPFISDWCRAVMAKANELVGAGVDVIGPDGKPYKFIEGKLGDRKWSDEKAAEAALTGVLGPDAYQPQKILTASGADKKLNKKKTAQAWKDVFVPLIKRAPGKPMLTLGSDPRPSFSPASTSDEFDVENEE